MDSDQGKLFIGGISWDTNEDKLKEHFSNYGDVLSTSVMREKNTGKPRGFGFVVFADPSILDRVLEDKHVIDGRTVDAKRAFSREDQQISVTSRVGNPNSSMNSGSGGNIRTKKIFVGGLPPTLTEENFRQYFESYGHVTDVVLMYDQNSGRPRGFGFISFDSEEAVDMVLHKSFHDLNGKQVEVKRALPKDANPGASGRMSGAGGGGYQGYGASSGNQNAYDGRMDSSRYMQPQSAAGGFTPYGSSAYSAPGYGYGPANNGIGYGAYGSYGGATAGYGGPAGATYGNPNVPNAAYAGGPPGGPRSSWPAQTPSGYGSMGYGNTAAWGASSGGAGSGGGGPGSVTAGQSPSGAAGYGNQGYGYAGYGGYGGSDSSYGNPGVYGAVGGRTGSAPNSNASGSELQGTQASGNYGTPHGNGSHGGQVGYSGGYGSVQSRQAQQQ
ncbi:heterogeneous nuclear ribonucleoprotein 1-like isoform X2 [Gastrolobium bilobum]|uniref:heterogeneous nuclear ribonucleoprotein 1-like isoform X2 n=1 Tax=Gastrolobium bilobum TaxID=150636 RepID=UPI002AAF6B06|nr:heterogeneous nuclear ribonucleoprotein 1-like isoform X2 [Gastrolobium bilobum]